MSIDEIIRKIVIEELDKRQRKSELIPVAEFCASKKISRVTIWRAEKSGQIKLTRIGKSIFIDTNQFV